MMTLTEDEVRLLAGSCLPRRIALIKAMLARGSYAPNGAAAKLLRTEQAGLEALLRRLTPTLGPL